MAPEEVAVGAAVHPSLHGLQVRDLGLQLRGAPGRRQGRAKRIAVLLETGREGLDGGDLATPRVLDLAVDGPASGDGPRAVRHTALAHDRDEALSEGDASRHFIVVLDARDVRALGRRWLGVRARTRSRQLPRREQCVGALIPRHRAAPAPHLRRRVRLLAVSHVQPAQARTVSGDTSSRSATSRPSACTAMAKSLGLVVVRIAFHDGLVINDGTDLRTTIGNREAVSVIAALDGRSRPPEWWDDQRFAQAATDGDRARYEALFAQFADLADVARVERPGFSSPPAMSGSRD